MKKFQYISLCIFFLLYFLILIPDGFSQPAADPAIAQDKYEPDNSPDTAAVILINSQEPSHQQLYGYEWYQTHNFYDQGDEDWVKFYALEGQYYKITVFSPGANCDPVIQIYGEDKTTLINPPGKVDYYVEGKPEYAEFKCPSDGIYYARITQCDTGSTGCRVSYGQGTEYNLELTQPYMSFDGMIYGTVTPNTPAKITTTARITPAMPRSDGSYFMAHIAGDFTLTATADGYAPKSVDFSLPENGTAVINIDFGQAPDVEPFASITSPSSDMVIRKGESVYFQGNGTGGNGTLTYSWNFGAGAASVEVKDPGNIMFQNPGIYNVIFTVRDQDGDTASAYISITVNDIVQDNIPAADIQASKTEINQGESIYFFGSVNSGDLPLTYFWDFGGGAANSYIKDPGNVIFSGAGFYTITFKVTDADGDIASDYLIITVKQSVQPKLAADFGQYGIYLYDGSIWQWIAGNAEYICAWGSRLIASFGGYGLYVYEGANWQWIAANPEGVAVWGNTLVGDFGAYGIMIYDGVKWNPFWGNPEIITGWGNKLVASFAGYGLYIHDGTSWTKIAENPEAIIEWGNRLVADFGNYGIYAYDGAAWNWIGGNPESITAWGNKLVASFAGYGLYVYDGAAWNWIGINPEGVTVWGNKLVADFGAYGLYVYDTTWIRVAGNPEQVIGLNLN